MVEVKKDTILVASIKTRKKQTKKEGKTIMSSLDALAKSLYGSHSGNFSFSLNFFFNIFVVGMLWCNGPCIIGKEMLHMAYSLNLHAPDHQMSSWELGEHTSPSTVNPSRKTLLAELKASNARLVPLLNDAAIESDAQKLNKAVRNGDKTMLIKDEEIVRILTTRSKPHLNEVFKCYYDDFDRDIAEV
ncbi:hypothetical protein AAG906_011215 [Vitis piasezkii]